MRKNKGGMQAAGFKRDGGIIVIIVEQKRAMRRKRSVGREGESVYSAGGTVEPGGQT